MKYSFPSRTKAASIIILLLSLVLVTRLFFVQALHNASYSVQADHQYATPSSNIFERGTIFFSNKNLKYFFFRKPRGCWIRGEGNKKVRIIPSKAKIKLIKKILEIEWVAASQGPSIIAIENEAPMEIPMIAMA